MRTRTLTATAAALGTALLLAAPAARAQTIFSGGGTTAATTALNDFQAAIGGANNGNAAGTQPTGFRRINWDAVPIPAAGNDINIDADTIGMATDRFKNRGALFQEVYAISDNGFTSVNPDVTGQFPAFTPAKTFAMFNDNVIEMNFGVPGSLTPGLTRGFGAIFLDVELANTSTIEYFSNGTSLGTFSVPVTPTSGEASFLGVLFNDPSVTNVTLTLGNATPFSFNNNVVTSGGPEGNGVDLVVTDDFVYAEPQINSAAAPEPGTVALFGIGILTAAALLHKRLCQNPVA
jgi:hypothetical protein